jgi:hypothetical protein
MAEEVCSPHRFQEERKGPGCQYLLQGHIPNDLMSLPWALPPKGSITSQPYHKLVTHGPLKDTPIQSIAVSRVFAAEAGH